MKHQEDKKHHNTGRSKIQYPARQKKQVNYQEELKQYNLDRQNNTNK